MDNQSNAQDKNAGNGGDVVKHTVYLTVLEFFLEREPWRGAMQLRECHAGRGIYHIPSDHRSRPLLSCLHLPRPECGVLPIASAQRSSLQKLGRWPDAAQNVEHYVEWYAGSALVNAHKLADSPGRHTVDFYERDPKARQDLRDALTTLRLPARLSWRAFNNGDDTGEEFDGEAYIEREVGNWGRQDVILLDPFAMRSQEDQGRRDRYASIFDSVIRRGSNAPPFILFWVWGRHQSNQCKALDDLNGTAVGPLNGYSGLRGKLHDAGLAFVRIKWCWEQWFAMWVVPALLGEDLAELELRLQAQCQMVTCLWKQCGHKRPDLEVMVDRPQAQG